MVSTQAALTESLANFGKMGALMGSLTLEKPSAFVSMVGSLSFRSLKQYHTQVESITQCKHLLLASGTVCYALHPHADGIT